MSTPPTTPDGSGESARVRCVYCGANNFPSANACWQCGRPLQAARTVSTTPAAAQAPLSPAADTSSALAMRAAATLGLMLPFVGIPVGIVFLMLDDPRKAQIGWVTLGWSVAGTILNTILLILPLWGLFKALLPHGSPGPGGIPSIPGLPGANGTELILLLVRSFYV